MKDGSMQKPEADGNGKPTATVVHHGHRLRHARLVKGYTLRQLAERVDCSESMLSKLENSRLSPSLSLLHRLAIELDISAADLLIQSNDSGHDRNAIVFAADHFKGPRNGSAESEVKIWFDRILPLEKTGLLQVNMQHLLPGAEQERFLSHEGEEFTFVLEGALEIIFEDKSHVLSAGEGIYYPSTRAHRYRNAHDGMTRSLWVGTPPVM